MVNPIPLSTKRRVMGGVNLGRVSTTGGVVPCLIKSRSSLQVPSWLAANRKTLAAIRRGRGMGQV